MLLAMGDIRRWRKPRRSFSNGQCVEAGEGPGVIAVRDSRLAESPVLTFSSEGWAAFTAGIKRGAR